MTTNSILNNKVRITASLLALGTILYYISSGDERGLSFLLIAIPSLFFSNQKVTHFSTYNDLYGEAAKTIENFVAGTCDPETWNDFLNHGIKGDARFMELQRVLADIPTHYPPTETENYCSPKGVEQMLKIAGIIKNPDWATAGLNDIVSGK